MSTHRSTGYCAQIRAEGRGWVTVGTSPTRPGAARKAARAFANAGQLDFARPVQVRVIPADAAGPAHVA